jgi:hypothetical protein
MVTSGELMNMTHTCVNPCLYERNPKRKGFTYVRIHALQDSLASLLHLTCYWRDFLAFVAARHTHVTVTEALAKVTPWSDPGNLSVRQ